MARRGRLAWPAMATRGSILVLLVCNALLLLLLPGCSRSSDDPPVVTRSYAMGFSWFPPRPDLALAVQVADAAAPHSDAALILASVPWEGLLAGQTAEALVRANELGLAELYRSKGLRVVVSIDPTNGLDRASDAPALVARGRSIAEPAIQALYRSYVLAMARVLQPAHLGIASETNFVRSRAPMALYNGLRAAANAAAADVRAAGLTAVLFVTVQVEVAWGRPGGAFVGVGVDRTDFPFVAALGLSSFPHLAGFDDPDSLPLDYFSRLVQGTPLPLLAIEGGWPSDSGSGIASSAEEQRRYVQKQSRLLDAAAAIAWFQINFTDLEEGQWPAGTRPFARLGLVDAALRAKPALAEWDNLLARPFVPAAR